MKRFTLAVALLLAASPVVASAQTQWTGNGHHYDFITGSFTWEEALADAATRSHLGLTGYLATVTSLAENQFLVSVNSSQQAWLSGSDKDSEGNWTWRAGPEAGQAVFHPIYPPGVTWADNAWGGQHFLVTNFNGAGNWDDGGGELNSPYPEFRIGYFVEYGGNTNVVPEPSSLALVLGGLIAAAIVRRRAR
ncbi:lectin-like protein [Gemmatimonas sp.]|uniref:lectin-like protein n=1 Tax=Gemmatimonas sp. TaxID=1962908 RepID=UPI003F702C63